jgi:NTE family protein
MTRRDLLQRADELEPRLARYGIKLRRDRLEDEQRTISTSLYGEMLPLYVAKGRKKRAQKGKLVSGLGNVSHLFSKAQ